MRSSNAEFRAAARTAEPDPVHRLFQVLPRPLRFLAVGGLGLTVDLAIFTLVIAQFQHPLIARFISLAAATLVTWRLNRALTFDRSGRHPADEAIRYAAVAIGAQAVSYAIFAILVVTMLGVMPQLAVLAGAAAGAFISYSGQTLFAFRRQTALAAPASPA
jgi:putative flippase GtrA